MSEVLLDSHHSWLEFSGDAPGFGLEEVAAMQCRVPVIGDNVVPLAYTSLASDPDTSFVAPELRLLNQNLLSFSIGDGAFAYGLDGKRDVTTARINKLGFMKTAPAAWLVYIGAQSEPDSNDYNLIRFGVNLYFDSVKQAIKRRRGVS